MNPPGSLPAPNTHAVYVPMGRKTPRAPHRRRGNRQAKARVTVIVLQPRLCGGGSLRSCRQSRLRPVVRPPPPCPASAHTTGPGPAPRLHPGRLSPPQPRSDPRVCSRLDPSTSCAVPVSGAGFVLVPRMRLCGTAPRGIAARSRTAQTHTGPHAERPGPRCPSALFPARPGLVGTAFRAPAAPGLDPREPVCETSDFADQTMPHSGDSHQR